MQRNDRNRALRQTNLPFTFPPHSASVRSQLERKLKRGNALIPQPDGRPASVPPACEHLPLLVCFNRADASGVIPLPGEGREAIEDWLSAQACDHGRERWCARMVYAIEVGDWARARMIAECAHLLSVVRAYGRAVTAEEKASLISSVRRTSSILADCQGWRRLESRELSS
jgi:hypothetical protein